MIKLNKKGPEMTSGELIEALAVKENLSKNKTRAIIKSLVSIILNEVKIRDAKKESNFTVEKGRHVSIAGLGVFETMTRKSRSARNPQTGETLTVPAKRVPKFRASKAFKESVFPGRRVWIDRKTKTKNKKK